MNNNIYKKIVESAACILFIAIIIWGVIVHYTSSTANITGIYHRILTIDEHYYYDVYVAFDSTNQDSSTITFYYVYNYLFTNGDSNPEAFGKLSADFTGHNINRFIGPLCFDSVEKQYGFYNIFKKPIHIFIRNSIFNGFDVQGNDLSAEDMQLNLSDGEDIILIGKSDLLLGDMAFEQVTQLPEEYQFQFSTITLN